MKMNTLKSLSWQNILIICSLAFNLAFMATLAYRLLTGHLPFSENTGQSYTEADSLQLAQEREEYKGKMQDIRKQSQALRQKSVEQRRLFAETLRQPKFDEKQARQALDEFLQSRQDLERFIGENFINMRQAMSSEQASRYFSRKRAEELNRAFAPQTVDRDSLFPRQRIQRDSLSQNQTERREAIRQIIKERIKERRKARR